MTVGQDNQTNFAPTTAKMPDSDSTAPLQPTDCGDSVQYWEGISADIDGMLGGITCVNKVDLQGSRSFLAKLGIGLKGGRRRVRSVLEFGAG